MGRFIQYIVLFLGICSPVLGQMRPSGPAVPFESYEAAKLFLETEASKGLFSGTVLVTRHGKIIIKEAYGMADAENQIPMNANTKINIGSINKAFTAVGVMQLVDAKKIKLSDKIVDYIPELKANMADEITILNLLEMKSGLGSYWDSKLFLSQLASLRNMEDYVPIIAEYELNAKPGTQRAYSNSSYELLGVLIQRVSGTSYYDYVQEHIYKKAQMTQTDAYERDSKVVNLAQGYSKYKEGEEMGEASGITKKRPFVYNVNDRFPVKGTAAGGGYSTLDDLRRFVLALVGNKLLSKVSTDLVVNHFRKEKQKSKTYSVRGGSSGINASVYYDLESDHMIIALSNFDPPVASEVMRRLRVTGY